MEMNDHYQMSLEKPLMGGLQQNTYFNSHASLNPAASTIRSVNQSMYSEMSIPYSVTNSQEDFEVNL